MSDGVPQLCHTRYDAARTAARILAHGWPDARSVRAALADPVDPIVVTRLFEDMAAKATH